jgi:hypothetical protein
MLGVRAHEVHIVHLNSAQQCGKIKDVSRNLSLVGDTGRFALVPVNHSSTRKTTHTCCISRLSLHTARAWEAVHGQVMKMLPCRASIQTKCYSMTAFAVHAATNLMTTKITSIRRCHSEHACRSVLVHVSVCMVLTQGKPYWMWNPTLVMATARKWHESAVHKGTAASGIVDAPLTVSRTSKSAG